MLISILDVLYNVCCMLYLIYLGEQLYHWTTKDRKKVIFSGMIFFLSLFCSIVPIHNGFPLFLLFYLGELTAWWLLCSAPWKNKIPATMFLFFFIGFMESIMVFFLDMLLGHHLSANMIQLLSILLIFIFTGIITHQAWFTNIIQYKNMLSKWQSSSISLIVFIGTGINSFAAVLHEEQNNNELIWPFRILTAFSLCIVFSTIIWLIIECQQREYYFKQNLLKEEFIHTQQNYYRTLYEKDKELRGFKHDIASQLGVLQLLLEQGNLEQAKELLSQCHESFKNSTFQQIHVGNEILDTILSVLKQNATENNISLDVIGKMDNASRYDVYQLCTIFSNAINNGIEACTQMDGQKLISVKIMEHNHTLFCSITNPATYAMYQTILNKQTSKADTLNHGFGISNIRRAVTYLNGTMDYYFRDEKITLEIYI